MPSIQPVKPAEPYVYKPKKVNWESCHGSFTVLESPTRVQFTNSKFK